MKQTNLKKSALFLIGIPALLITAVLIISGGDAAVAQPGSVDDPVVTLSYIGSALSMHPAELEGGEDLEIPAGMGVILLDGRARLDAPSDGRSWIVNVTAGTISTESIDLVPGNMYMPVTDQPSQQFTIIAWESSVIAVRGLTGASVLN